MGTFTNIVAIRTVLSALFFMFSCQKNINIYTFLSYVLMIMFLIYCGNMCNNLN